MNFKTLFPLFLVVAVMMLFNCSSINDSSELAKDFYANLQAKKYEAIEPILDAEALNASSWEEWQQLFVSKEAWGELKKFRRTGFKTSTDINGTICILDYKVTYEQKQLNEQLTFVKRDSVYKLLSYQYKE